MTHPDLATSVSYPLEIRWHGRGGQGAVTASNLLAEVALAAGKFIQSFPQFGSERRGAPIVAYTRIDEKEITLYNTIPEPNLVVVLDPSLLELPPTTGGLRPGGLLLVNAACRPTEIRDRLQKSDVRVATVPASAIALATLGRPVTNTAMLGALLAVTDLISLPELLQIVRKKFAQQYTEAVVEANLEAVRKAYRRVLLG